MAIKLEILTENKEALRAFGEIRDAVVKTSNLLEQIAKDMGKFGKAGVDAGTKTEKALEQANQSVRELNKEVDKGTASFDKMAKAAGAFFTLQAAQGFAQKIFAVRSEIESLQTSFRVLVGDKDKADQLFQSIKEFAVSTPMQMKDLAASAQMMLNFGLPLEQVMENLKAIGDISGGDAQRFQALSLAFSQASASGKLMTQDLMQMVNAGFQPLEIMSQKTGKSIGQLKDEVSAGAISADMLRQAFIDATSEGGKFYGMMEEQSKTLKGAYSNLQGAIDDMLNSIGEKTQGAFTTAIELTTTLAKNYEKVGTVILGLIGTYGLYKTAVLAVAAAEKGWTVVEGIHYALLVAQEKGQKLLNAAMNVNPYVAAATALGLVVTAMAALISKTSEADEFTKKLNDTFAKTQAEIASEQRQIDTLFDKLGKAKQGTAEYKSVKDQILSQYGSYLSGLGAEISSLRDVEGAYKAVSRAARDAAMARGMEAAMRGAQDSYTASYSRNYDKIYKAIEKNYGTDTANRLMSGLQKRLQRDGKLSADVIDKFGALKGVKAGWLVNMSVNETEYQKQREGIEQKFKVDDKTADESHKIAVRDKKAIEEDLQAAQKQLEGLSKQEAMGKKGAELKKKIRGYQKEISEAYDPKYGDKQAKAAATAAKQQAAAERKAQAEAIRMAEAMEKMEGLRLKQQAEREKEQRDLELSIIEAKIAAMEDGEEKVIAQIELDYEKEKEAIRRGNEEIRLKRIEEAKAFWDADPKNKGKDFYKSDAYKNEALMPSFTLAELDAAEAMSEAAEAKRKQAYKKLSEQNTAAMLNYLKQYGDYEQQRLAITEEYDQKINDTKIEGEKLMLAKQKEEELRQVDERFGLVTQAMADLFADASKKSVTAIQKIIDKYEALVKYMEGHKGSADREGLAALGISEREIQKILSGDISIKELTDRLKELKGELKDRSPYQSFVGNMKAIVEQLKKAKNAADVGEGITAMTDAIKSFLPAVKEFGSNIANIFGTDNSNLNGVIDGLGGLMTAGGGIGQMMSGDIVGGVMTTVQGISAMVDAFDGLFGADYSQYQKLVEEYTNLIGVWDELIAKKREYISESYGAEAIKAGQEAESLVQKELEAWRTLGRERLNAGASAGSHSIGVRIRQKMTAADWKGVGYDLGGRLEGLFDLSSEQLQKLKENAPTFWAKLDDDVRKYLENIIKGAETLEEIQDQTRNQLTSTTFDSVYDNFVSSLADMDKSAYDFSKDFEKYMFNAVLNAKVGDLFKKRLEDWYKAFADKMEGGLTPDEIASLKSGWDTIVKEGIAARDELSKVTGYGSSGEGDGTFRSVSSFTQEQGDVLNGRLTAIQIAVQTGNALRQQIAANLSVMGGLVGGSSAAIDDMRDMVAISNTHLADIVTLNKKMLSDFGEKIERIAVNTQNL